MMDLPRVLLIYNEPVLPRDHPDAPSEFDVVETAMGIEKILVDAGLPVRKLGFARDPADLLRELRDHPADVVFNLFEGLADQTETEISVAALLEWLNVPFTGSSSFAIALGRDKVRTKLLLQGAGLPTAPFAVVERLPVPVWPYRWPAIVKPACQDSSVGIDQNSVVENQADLDQRTGYLLDRYGPPILVEQFVFGREFHANIVEEPGLAPTSPAILSIPLSEVMFKCGPDLRWPIYTFAAKWDELSAEYKASPLLTPVWIEPELWERVQQVTQLAYKLIGLRDYGRVDLRLTDDGQPYILEVNPNPYLLSSMLVDGLAAIGRKHTRMMVDLVRLAASRGNRRESS
jgi:D-alanine-D-alanine ligase